MAAFVSWGGTLFGRVGARSGSLALLVLLGPLAACGARTMLAEDAGARADGAGVDAVAIGDAAAARDAVGAPDRGAARDGTAACGRPLGMGFVTDRPPDPALSDGARSYVGRVAYLGKLRNPMATSPQFDRELELRKPDGSLAIIVQYFLPAGRALPIGVGQTLELVLRQRRAGPGDLAQGLVILDPTISSWPVLAVLEPAPYGQAFDEKDARLSPLVVERLVRRDCRSYERVSCGTKYWDRLRLSWTTGAGMTKLELAVGETGPISIFGRGYDATNLASWHLENPCPDAQVSKTAFLLLWKPPVH